MTAPASPARWLRLLCYALPLVTGLLLFGPLKAVPPPIPPGEEYVKDPLVMKAWAAEVTRLTKILFQVGAGLILLHIASLIWCGKPRAGMAAALATTVVLLSLAQIRVRMADKLAAGAQAEHDKKSPYSDDARPPAPPP